MSTRRVLAASIALTVAAVVATMAWLDYEGDQAEQTSTERQPDGSLANKTRATDQNGLRQVSARPPRVPKPTEPQAPSKVVGEVARSFQWGSAPPDLPPGVLTSTDLFEDDKPAMAAMQEAFGPYGDVNSDADDCLRRWTSRGGKLGANYDWDFVLHVVSDGERGRVVEVRSDNWPDAFDATLRDCYRRAYSRVEFEVAHAFDYRVSYPMCLKNGG